MRRAPWLDANGGPIYEGDTITHPSGEKGTVVYWPHEPAAYDQWRVDYDSDMFHLASRLSLQLGSRKGGAVASRPAVGNAVLAAHGLTAAFARLGCKKTVPCPFCGSADVDARFAVGYAAGDLTKRTYAAGCNNCSATGPGCASPEASLVAWERRRPVVTTAAELRYRCTAALAPASEMCSARTADGECQSRGHCDRKEAY